MPKSYLVQEEDGVSRFTLEEGDGFILLEEFGVVAIVVGRDEPVASVTGGTVTGVDISGGDEAAAIVVPT